MANCIFCESAFADPIIPANRQKICSIFNVSFNGKKLLHESRICTRCQVQVELVDNALKLKTEMNQCLQEKLSRSDTQPAPPAPISNGVHSAGMFASPQSHFESVAREVPPRTMSEANSISPPTTATTSAPSFNPLANGVTSPPVMTAPSVPSSIAYSMPPPLASPKPLYSGPTPTTHPVSDGPFMCGGCGRAFKEHADLAAHDTQCKGMAVTPGSPNAMPCDRCGQSLKHRTHEDRIKHIVQCQGQGLRRGRPSIGITSCPKCGLSLKNRMNHDRINHVERCNGSGLKRGRPSLKADEKFKCDKCGRNLWSRDQLQLHSGKCDGSHVERRGRKPGDNICMVCGENLVYRHILKKHLRQAHGINPQNLDDSVIAAVKSEAPADELSTPYKKILLNQIQQRLANASGSQSTPIDSELPLHNSTADEEGLNLTVDSSLSHRKKARPTKYVTDDELFKCPTCEKRFEHQLLYEQHYCCKVMKGQQEFSDNYSNGSHQSTEPSEPPQSASESTENQQRLHPLGDGEDNSRDGGDSNAGDSTQEARDYADDASGSREVDGDLVSAISSRGEVKPQQSMGSTAGRGSAIEQVISDLILANKNRTSPIPTHSISPANLRQSIST